MIKQMERQFTLVAILSISLVMLIILTTINVINYQRNMSEVQWKLEDILAGNHGPKPPGVGLDMDVNREAPPFVGDDIRVFEKDDRRSFFVVVDETMTVVDSDISNKNLVYESQVGALIEEVLVSEETQGLVENFRYAVAITDEGTKIAFIDYTFEMDAEQNLLLISLAVFVASIILVSIMVKLLLKPVMKPTRDAYRRQKQFITDASHELKTPLTVIATNMQLIEMEGGVTEWTKSVANQTERLKDLTNELVSLSRMDEEASHLTMMGFDLSELVQDVMMGFEPAIIAQGKSLEATIEDDISYHGDYDAMERVLSVVLSNAMKYADEGGTIEVALKRKGKKLKLKISNTTNPIEPGDHSEYFERFYRSDASRNSETGGFGIGLAIAKAIVEEHKGKIKAFSPDGRSLDIQITL